MLVGERVNAFAIFPSTLGHKTMQPIWFGFSSFPTAPWRFGLAAWGFEPLSPGKQVGHTLQTIKRVFLKIRDPISGCFLLVSLQPSSKDSPFSRPQEEKCPVIRRARTLSSSSTPPTSRSFCRVPREARGKVSPRLRVVFCWHHFAKGG